MQKIANFSQFLDSHAEDKTQASGIKISLLGTVLFWILIIVFLAVSPYFKKPPKFNTVKITLASPEITKTEKSEKTNPSLIKDDSAKASESAVPKQNVRQRAEVPQTTKESVKPAAKKTVEQTQKSPAKKETAKSAENKPSPAAQKIPEKASQQSVQTASKNTAESKPVEQPKKADIKYKKSVEELMEQQMSGKPKTDFDDSMFADDAVVSRSVPVNSPDANVKALSGASALSGSAGTAADSSSGAVVSEDSRDSSRQDSVSAGTAGMLANVVAATYSQNIGNGLSAEISVQRAKSTDGKFSLSLENGSARALLDPKEPKITLSPEAGKLIDGSRMGVRISFRIMASGNVPASGISFHPASALPLEVQTEIREQISKWRFVPASYDGQANFDYSIIKR